MIAKVYPAIKLPRQATAFDYLIEGDLPIGRGSLVFVPWRRRTVLGVVAGLAEESEVSRAKLKPISGLATTERLSPDWIDTLEWCAERYLTAVGTAARCFLPTPPKRYQPPEPTEAHTLSEDQLNLGTGSQGRIKLYASAEDRRLAMTEAVERTLKQGLSAIVLAPHRDDIKDAAAFLQERVGDRLVEIHGALAAGRLWRNWAACQAGQAQVAVGSRLAAMAPLKRLGLIVILEADSPDHKQYDQNPRYDARSLARRRAAGAGAELLVMTQSPRVEECLALKQGFRLEKGAWQPAPVVLADVSATGPDWTGPISPVALGRLSEALQKGQNALIFHNRQGTAGALICADCRAAIRCPGCGLAMSYHRNQLHCHRCGRESASPLGCPECQSVRLRPLGWGTAAIAKHLKDQLPGVPVLRFDKETGRPDSLPSGGSLVIGSRLLVHDLAERHDGRFGAVLATSAEDLLRHPGFRVLEEAWGLIMKLRYLAGANDTELVLQTLTVEDPRVRALSRDVEPFLENELAERQSAGYPPVGRLVIVVSRGFTEAQASQAAWRSHRLLEPAVREAGPATVLSRPFRPAKPVAHGQWRQAIAIRTPRLTDRLAQALRQLPEEFIIEPDPETPI